MPDRYAAPLVRRLISTVHSVRTMASNSHVSRFVATFEEEMMMMQEEGMITANEYSIDCRTCGSGKCA